jgi:origin recognition complex subunit 5
LTQLYDKYCEPLADKRVVPHEEMKRRLFSHLQPHISLSLNDVFRVLSRPSLEANTTKKDLNKHKAPGTKKQGVFEVVDDDIDFHMSMSAKYLLISAFIASRNPATLDASLSDSTSGSDVRKRKRKSSDKSMEQKEAKEQVLPMKGPGAFPLERLLAIYQCITSVEEYALDESQEIDNNEFANAGLMCEVLLQLSSLCNANIITKGGSCPLEGSARYRSTVSEDTALQVARSLKFPLSKYLYRR